VFSSILKLGHSFLNKYPAGDVLQRMDHDLNEFSWFACSGIFRPLEGIIMLVAALFFLLKINVWLTIITVLPVSFAAIGWLKISPHMYRFYHHWRTLIAMANNHLQSSFSGIKLVKSYCIQEQSHQQYNAILKDRVNAAVKVIKIEIMTDSLFVSIEEIGIILVLLAGGMFVIMGNLTIGEFIAFNAYIVLLVDPMIRIGNFFVSRKRAQVQNERLEEIKDFPADVEDRGCTTAPDNGKIALRKVSFRYSPDARFVLDSIDADIPFGKRIGFAGTVGSGKTTLQKLLMRLADPTQGDIAIGKTAITNIPLKNYRSLYGYVPQEPVLFSDTIHNNIAFGRPCSLDEINKVVHLAQLDTFVKTAPQGLQEMVGERGLKLSGGEKQRIAIARALLGRPKVLILDDATSNLDAETEKRLIDTLTNNLNMTMIIISHRLSILSVCDHIYVLDKGRIVEQGDHASLIALKDLYWNLYKHQIG
jgi:ATP-binding cassette subfamily B multidrug efflux pump